MFNQLKDYYFWFVQPPTILTQADKYFGYLFLAGLILAIGLWAWSKFIKHSVNKKLIKKFSSPILNLGISGLVWFGLRFENTPLFGQRYWAGLVMIVSLVWLGFVLKFLVFNYRTEKVEFEKESIKNKYIPGKQ